MFIQHPITGSTGWYSIMMVPFGRGGAGFSVLDITDEDKPYHLYTIFNDDVNNKILRTDHNGNQFEYEYVDDTYSFLDLVETKTVSENYTNDNDVDKTCNSSLLTACYESNTWTFPVIGVTKDDLNVFINGTKITNFTVNLVGGDTKITFDRTLFYNGDTSGLPGSKVNDTDLEISVTTDAIARLSTSLPVEYNYTKLGETWSSPRIFRMPNNGAGDTNTVDDIYVAVMGAGYGATSRTKGSGVYVINLFDVSAPGKVEKEIVIADHDNDNITNSVLATPVVITADQSNDINYRGALVYINDLEGKVIKINLTNMTSDNDEDNPKQIDLYDNTTLFDVKSTEANGRYMFHGMDATIGQSSNNFWLFTGTGDYERVTSKQSSIDNYMVGIRDKDFPNYKEVSAFGINALQACQDTTDDATGVKCPIITDDQVNISGVGAVKKEFGWYIKLKKAQKVVAEPTVTKGIVYFPVYEPSTSANQCDMGKAFICAVDDECGTNFSSELGDNEGENKDAECLYVGKGVLSKIVVFGSRLFANIAGESTQDKKDLVTLDSIAGDTRGLRNSWREGNF
jgi:type IV pilus assembly protein PilY1